MLMTCTDAIPSIQPSWLPGMSECPSFLVFYRMRLENVNAEDKQTRFPSNCWLPGKSCCRFSACLLSVVKSDSCAPETSNNIAQRGLDARKTEERNVVQYRLPILCIDQQHQAMPVQQLPSELSVPETSLRRAKCRHLLLVPGHHSSKMSSVK